MGSAAFQVALCLYLLMPAWAVAQPPAIAVIKDPLNYPLGQYGFILAVSLLGGLVGWWSKVRKGELHIGSVAALVGELTTSALAGLLTFWVCEYLELSPLLTGPLAGMAGYAGGRGLDWAEAAAKKRAERMLGIEQGDERKP